MAVRVLLARGADGVTAESLSKELTKQEQIAGRDAISPEDARTLLDELAREGFCSANGDVWSI